MWTYSTFETAVTVEMDETAVTGERVETAVTVETDETAVTFETVETAVTVEMDEKFQGQTGSSFCCSVGGLFFI